MTQYVRTGHCNVLTFAFAHLVVFCAATLAVRMNSSMSSKSTSYIEVIEQAGASVRMSQCPAPT